MRIFSKVHSKVKTTQLVILAIVLVLSVTIFPFQAVPASALETTVAPVADGYTDANAPTTVKATATTFRVDNSPQQNGYVKFDVPVGVVGVAKLRLTAGSSTGSTTDIKAVGSSWDETNLTYSTAPAPGATVGSINGVASGETYYVDVTSAVTSGSTVSFAITTSSTIARKFHAREASDPLVRPQLIINDTVPPSELNEPTVIADGYTKSDVPTGVFSTANKLRIDGSPEQNAYIKFNVPAGTVESAVLRLTAASSTGSTTDIHRSNHMSDMSWDESNLSYNNAPSTTALLGSINGMASGQTYDIDVTSAVTGLSTTAFVLTTTSGTARTFYSSEATSGQPELIVTYSENTQDTIHTISQMEQDAIGGNFSTKARFEGRHGGTAADPYMFDMTVHQVSGDFQGMNLVFREIDAINFDQLDIEEDKVLLRQKIDGNIITHASGCDGYGTFNNSYRVKLLLKGTLWEVYQGNETTPCVTWTDAANTFPVGENASYYCMPGNYCVWEKVEARPVNMTPVKFAWDFTGQNPGYNSPQTISTVLQSVLESRPVYTLGNYRFGDSYNDGSSPTLDIIEHGADGNVEYHLDVWSDFGTRIVYRATVGQYGYHVQFNDGSTKLRRKNLDNTWTTLATSPTPIPLNRHVKVVVEGGRHRLIDETDCNPTCTTYWDVTDTTYTKGNKTYWGNIDVDGALIRGTFRVLP